MTSSDTNKLLIRMSAGIQPDALNLNSRGQLNLFTGEVEPPKGEPERVAEERWLFDPDFRLVLPEDRAGKEILVEPGLAVQFPADGVSQRAGGSRAPSTITNFRSEIADSESRIPNFGTGPLIFGKRPFVPSKPRVAKAADLAQVIVSGFGVYLGKR
ncbi:MAG: hypothetical protein ACRD2G_17765, partial [Terriglobia bacterium]